MCRRYHKAIGPALPAHNSQSCQPPHHLSSSISAEIPFGPFMTERRIVVRPPVDKPWTAYSICRVFCAPEGKIGISLPTHPALQVIVSLGKVVD